MHRALALLALVAFFAGCKSYKTKRVDPADDDVLMGTGLESADVLAISNLADSLLEVDQLTGPHVEGIPTVAIHPIRNDTDIDFDAELLVRSIRQKLVKKASHRVTFVSRDQMDEAVTEAERAAKRKGEYTSSKQEVRTGADFYLTGTASSISKVGRGIESRALFIDFRLIDSENGEIVWEDGFKTKKVGKAGVVYR